MADPLGLLDAMGLESAEVVMAVPVFVLQLEVAVPQCTRRAPPNASVLHPEPAQALDAARGCPECVVVGHKLRPLLLPSSEVVDAAHRAQEVVVAEVE